VIEEESMAEEEEEEEEEEQQLSSTSRSNGNSSFTLLPKEYVNLEVRVEICFHFFLFFWAISVFGWCC